LGLPFFGSTGLYGALRETGDGRRETGQVPGKGRRHYKPRAETTKIVSPYRETMGNDDHRMELVRMSNDCMGILQVI